MSDTARVDAALTALADVAIELPSWAFGNSGTRFRVFPSAGTPRTVQEKIADAAQVHRSPVRRRPSRSTSRGTRSTTTRPCAPTPRTSA